jgi:uncharacterized protein YacL
VANQRESVPSAVLEVLRFCVVVFFAGLGYQVTRVVERPDLSVGPFDVTGLGILLGAAIGYVLGGVLGRLTGRSLSAAETALGGRSAEQLLAGMAGGVLGVLLTAGLGWPMLLVGSQLLTVPLFLFVCITVATLGFRVGLARRDGLLALLGPRAGLAAPRPAIAALPRVLDTSVAVDGRIVDVVRAGFLHGTLLLPQPVLDELQGLADASDDLRRSRGRRGLDTLESLRRQRGVDVEPIGDEAAEVPEVDAKLVRICLDRGAALLTLDTNLAKAAGLAGCRVMNLHALTLALRPPVGAGDQVNVLLTRAGKEPGQGVGYLDDGTMVVVERSRERVGREVHVAVTSVMTTANGRLVFARPVELPSPVPSPLPGAAVRARG